LTPVSFKRSMQAVRGGGQSDGKTASRLLDEKASNPTEVKTEVPQGGVGVLLRRAPPRRRTARRGGRRNGMAGKGMIPKLPPTIDAILVVPFRIRYLASAAVGANVTRQMIAGALGGIVTATNSTHTAWASSFRITHFDIWPSVATGGVNADVQWTQGSPTAEQALTRERNQISTIPSGVTVTGGFRVQPPKGSYQQMWQTCNVGPTDYMFTITVPSGSVVDFCGAFTLFGIEGINQVTNTIATGALGVVFYLPLDGVGAHHLTPQGLSTTF